MTKDNPFKYFRRSREIIRLAVMMYVRFSLSLRNVEDLLHERGIDVCHKSVRFWWNRFGPLFAAEIRKKRVDRMRSVSQWRWHLDEMFVKINDDQHYLWRLKAPSQIAGPPGRQFIEGNARPQLITSDRNLKLISHWQ